MYPHPKHRPPRSTLQGTVRTALVVGLLAQGFLTGCSSKTPTNSAASPPPPPPSPQVLLAQRCAHITQIAKALEYCRDSPDYSPQGMYQRCEVGHDGIKSLKSVMPLELSQSKQVCEAARNLYSMNNDRMVAPMRPRGYSDTYIEAHFAEKLAESERGCASDLEMAECVDMALPIIADMFAATKAKLNPSAPTEPGAPTPPAPPVAQAPGLSLGPKGLSILEAHPQARAEKDELRRIFQGFRLRAKTKNAEGEVYGVYELHKDGKHYFTIDHGPAINRVQVFSPEVEGPHGARVGQRFEELAASVNLSCMQGDEAFYETAFCTVPNMDAVSFLFGLGDGHYPEEVPAAELKGRKMKAMLWYRSN